MTYSDKSYASLYREIRCQPSIVALFLDEELAFLAKNLPLDYPLAGRIVGECLTRMWLYEDNCPEALTSAGSTATAASGELLEWARTWRRGMASANINRSIPEQPEGMIKLDRVAWDWLRSRVVDFLEADGIIAIVDLPCEKDAFPVPFSISLERNCACSLFDCTNTILSHWSENLSRVKKVFDGTPPILQLLCECGERGKKFEGGSFVLALLMATKRRTGEVGDFSPLSVLFSGSFDDRGRLDEIAGIEAKKNLAVKMGVSLFGPGIENSSERFICLPTGSNATHCVERIAKSLDELGLTDLTPKAAHRRLLELKEEICQGLLPLEIASRRLNRYKEVFLREPDNEFCMEGQLFSVLLAGSIANHLGDPGEGQKCADRAEELSSKARNHLATVDATASWVVSLTDLGLLAESERKGRELLRWVETEFQGGARDRLKARMIACGVLGGQPLIHQALIRNGAETESLCLLRRACEAAESLDDSREIARDLTQIALWHALFDPEKADSEILRIFARLESIGAEAKISLQYLMNIRYLAAYRRLLVQGNSQISDIGDWELPKNPPWLYGTALKYRGAILAADGNLCSAAHDFHESVEILSKDKVPLKRFIAATAALQAAESLCQDVKNETRHRYADFAATEFTKLATMLYGIHADPAWAFRAQAILVGGIEKGNNPQNNYRY